MTNQHTNFVLLILILTLGGIFAWAIWSTQQQPSPSTSGNKLTSTRSQAQNLPGSFTFVPNSYTAKQGETFTVVLSIAADKSPLIGADAIISYDPESIDILGVKPQVAFPTYPRTTIDKENGRIIVSGLVTTSDGIILSSPTPFVTLTARAKKLGSGKIHLVSQAGSTSSSTITAAKRSENILGKTVDTSYTITN